VEVQRSLGERIRALRKLQGLTQEALAERAELHVTYISGLENGSRNPSLTALASLAKGFGLSLAELMEGVGGA
jgi:transcriptional regulator with XRE-family HTH domain